LWIFLRLGTFLELFFNSGASLRNFGLRVDFKETEGPLCKIPEITDFQILFSTRNSVDRVHGAVDRGQRARWRLAGAHR
jgi:hypothetical protein